MTFLTPVKKGNIWVLNSLPFKPQSAALSYAANIALYKETKKENTYGQD